MNNSVKKQKINWVVMLPILLLCFVFPPLGIILFFALWCGAFNGGMKDVANDIEVAEEKPKYVSQGVWKDFMYGLRGGK